MSNVKMDSPRLCALCGCDIANRHGLAKWCLKCQSSSARYSSKQRRAVIPAGQGRAHQIVYKAVLSGSIPPIETLKCVDCGVKAVHYDHRDYNKPLEVVPVCRSCNSKRGPAIALRTEMTA